MNPKSWRFQWHGWILGEDWNFYKSTGSMRGLIGISCSQLNQGIGTPSNSLANELPYDAKMCRDIWNDRWGLQPVKRVTL